MTTLTIRNVSPTLAASIDEAASTVGQSREEFLRRLLAERFSEPLAVIAWIRSDRDGETEYDSCPECGQDMTGRWFAITTARTLSGPVCEACATND